MRRFLRIAAATALVLVGLVTVASPASAKSSTPSSWRIVRYDVAAVVDGSGATDVTLSLDFDFASDAGHGPYITLPLRQEIGGDPDHWRMLDVSNVTASSPSGADATMYTTSNDDALLVRLGQDGRTWTGVQSYVITYTTTGLVAPKQAQSGLDEFNWNAVGPGWQVPIENISVSVTGPASVQRTACFYGSWYDQPCADSSSGETATFSRVALDKEEPMEVVAGFPAGTFTAAEPRLTKRFWIGNMFPVTPVTGATTAAVTLAGLGGVGWYLRRHGDRQYVGLTPGLSPAPGSEGTVGPATSSPVAVAFTPPKGARPGEIGVLIDATADNEDMTGTILDLAVRGHLSIEPLKKKNDYRFTRNDPADRLENYESRLLDRLFYGSGSVTTRDLRDRHDPELATRTRSDLRDRVTRDLRWFAIDPLKAQMAALAAGGGLIVLGVLLGFLLGFAAGFGFVALAPILTGIAVMVLYRRFSGRTAEGTAVLAQARGFKTYLATAEADQIRFEEGIDVFSRYLPYATVFGVADHWVKVFQQLAEQGRYSFDHTGWWVGSNFYGHGFTDSMSSFSHAMSSTITASTAGSSGGSGFSGGGGFGGGGGGGW